MKVLVCVLSSRESIVEAIARQKERLIPQDLFKNKKGPDYPVHFKVSTFNPAKETIAFDKFLLSLSKGMDAVLLLVENQHANLTLSVANAVFAAKFDAQVDGVGNFKNFFGSYFSPLFRNFFGIKTLMCDAEKEQAMMLPLRNFNAAELQEMARLACEESTDKNLVFNIESRLADIAKRRLPRKRSKYKMRYFIDDKAMHFVYGNEQHARFDTGKPHLAACELNGNFRFGKRIDTSRHYNASFGSGDDTHVIGKFADCHGTPHEVTKGQKKTHLNIFANDFF